MSQENILNDPASLTAGLYVVSTPIGNLQDITLRALAILKSVDLIACEDTRHTGTLLAHYHIKNGLTSYHEYNKKKQTPALVLKIKQGQSIALVSDAGTPGISDPGYYLIRAVIQENLPVIPIPGPSALLSALVISGLPSDRFVFEGFLPKRAGRKKSKLEELKQETRTMIFYESPYRALDALHELLQIFGDRPVALARELTKKFETVLRGKISDVIRQISGQQLKGEIVIIVEGKNEYPES